MNNRKVFSSIFVVFTLFQVNFIFAAEKNYQSNKNEQFRFYSKPISTCASFAAIVGGVGFFFKQKPPRNRYLAMFVTGSAVQQSLNIMTNFYEMRNNRNKIR